ncbi:GNAT family N-acetyltransferase [Candidatus Woesearchaeota archaeon]|nr:GNAT family N-acetyltransferase [Candidatus Woesearchaeota archaeon]
MRADEPDIRDIIEDNTAIAIFGFMGGDCFGNIYGCKDPGPSRTMYIYNLSVLQKFQGLGLGSKLMQEFLNRSKAKGFSRVAGHFRHNGSLKIACKFKARSLAVIENWDGTGEPFSYCVIDL